MAKIIPINQRVINVLNSVLSSVNERFRNMSRITGTGDYLFFWIQFLISTAIIRIAAIINRGT